MVKLFRILLSLCLIGGLCACSKQEAQNIKKEDDVSAHMPLEVTEDEMTSDINLNELKDYNQKIELKELMHDYEVVVYTVYGYPFVKDTEEWNELFGQDDSVCLSFKDDKRCVFRSFGEELGANYSIEGNVLTFVFDETEDEEENVPLEGVFIDNCIVMDLDGSKLYFMDKETEESLKEIEKIINQIETEIDLEEYK